ncbi:BLUF domain-containing protein [Dyadobacter sandarakinus]|uniref:BLUF domain-containing protein n=1 Tax=Dyadobacter sandarakinus TaxID=2747268 RepID=A0ABX7I4B2_9BACT|nr:BLUF domain-containing protein [Dyadobacter sandarakinus]QRR00698.1 BLUF domain-containing protein [Dyadobacter sandarakinus]
MVYSIVYVSSSSGLLADEELESIISKSRLNNSEKDITGVLLYCNGNIIQVLEGAEETVMDTFRRILRDHRHTQVTRLFAGMVPDRSFQKWSMGYSTMTSKDMGELKAAFPAIDNPHKRDLTGKTLSLIKNFYINNHRN